MASAAGSPLSLGSDQHAVVEGRLSCWGLCEQGFWWGLVTYDIAYGASRKAVTHWIPSWTLKRKAEAGGPSTSGDPFKSSKSAHTPSPISPASGHAALR